MPTTSPRLPTIDAHHHLWHRGGPLAYDWLLQPGLEPLQRDFEPTDLRPLLDQAGVDGTIAVQTLSSLAETRWLLDQAHAHPWIAGVVGWVDLLAPDVADQLAEFRADPRFVGVRHVVHDEPDRNWIVRAEAIRGLRVLEAQGVPFDLLFRVEHLPHAATLARALPDLPLVIDHLAKPPIRSGRWSVEWEQAFRAAGRFPNVMGKLSGLITEANHQAWTVDQLRPWVALALEVFGPDRLMFGTDWPVCLLAGSYAEVHQAAQDLMSGLSTSEISAVFGGTATRFYGVDPERVS